MAEAWSNTDAHVKHLKPKWISTCKTLCVEEETMGRWWELLVARHSESQRAYHTLAHLSELFDYMEEYEGKISDKTAVSLAIFFHDVIYWPKAGSPKNELDSAILFDSFGQEALPDGEPLGLAKGQLISKVYKWIVQTASHTTTEEDERDCKLFMDFDMAVLGRPAERYEAYAKQIRLEYGHVPEPAFCKARSAFLLSAAAGGDIFATEEFRTAFEEKARANMRQEGALLAREFAQCSLIARLITEIVLSKTFKCIKDTIPKIQLPGGIATIATGAYVAPQTTGCLALAAAGLAALFGLRVMFGAKYVRHPYPQPMSCSGSAVLAGSYNPPHFGHLEMLKYLAKAHTKVVAVIGVNPTKKYDVSPYQRQAILRAMIKDAGLTNVEVVVWGSLIFLHAHAIGASVMYRGIRTWREDGRGEKHLELLNTIYQPIKGFWPIPTAYLQGSPALTHVSSTLLRNRIKDNAPFDDLVPASCVEAVRVAYAPKDD